MFKIILLPSKMSDPVAASAPVPADIAAQRLSEAPIIESEWNNMSYKDRAAWWMSAKWYGYMSTEAYRRGDALNTEISCRYGEPGFFIATRVPYYEAQAAVSTIVSSVSVTPEHIVTTEPAVATIVETTTTTTTTATSEEALPVPTPTTSTTETAADEAATILREAIANNTSETQVAANSQHKKKKKKHHKPAANPGKGPGEGPGEGKTIEIRVGGQSK